jgi:hydroxymethylpyrimidine/phosphomethylpyrimidine kinase
MKAENSIYKNGNSLYSKENFRPVALSVAAFDPSGGAGVLADVKTFESLKVYGLSVLTGNTFQNDNTFKGISWLGREQKEVNFSLLADRFNVSAIKLGMHQNLEEVWHTVNLCRQYFPKAFILWDPVLSASAGYDLEIEMQKELLEIILSNITLITPNWKEVQRLTNADDALACAVELSALTSVLLKGGHSGENQAEDRLYQKGALSGSFVSERIQNAEKHGSGCVLSAAICSGLALGFELPEAIAKGKEYVTEFLRSNRTLLGYHLTI